MCGRYVLKALRDDIVKHFNLVDGLDYFDIHGYKMREEVFPGDWITAINNANRPEDIWWTIEDKDNNGSTRRAINAKAETITKVRMFADAFRTDRVLIPATGFHEWDTGKCRHVFTFDEPLFAFGGIARHCEIKGETRRCGAIITTEANDVVRPIHEKGRMPVVIHKYDYARWLEADTSSEELRRMMTPLPEDETHVEKAEGAVSAENKIQGSLF
ncbi:MAG TPA: SOS response-associated peptidase family protein [Pyrinomonadaceae bacterium]|nr:SOS response-associated peptidase family protein [Pyrinomonadaceae bacterium]